MNTDRTQNNLLVLAAILGGLSVAIGAFAAHGLKNLLSEQAMGWIATGVQYQQFHALALMGVILLWKQQPQWRGLSFSAGCFVCGILLFSGSLFTMAATDVRALGMITPLGGLAFLLGWSVLAVAVVTNAKSGQNQN